MKVMNSAGLPLLSFLFTSCPPVSCTGYCVLSGAFLILFMLSIFSIYHCVQNVRSSCRNQKQKYPIHTKYYLLKIIAWIYGPVKTNGTINGNTPAETDFMTLE